MKDVIKIKKPNQVSNVKVSHEASSFYADLSKQWAIKLDKPIENGEYSSKYYAKISEQYANSANKSAMSAEVAASNLEKFVINSLYFPELKISNEDTILNNLEREKRSTFDKSKFTITGNPTITDNGVASGFGSGNYLNTGYLLDTTKPWVIYSGKVKFNNATTLQTIWCSSYKNDASSDNNPMQIALNAQGKLRLLLSSVNNYGATTPDIANAIVGNNIFTTNTDYYFKLEFNGNKYTLSYSVDGANYITDITVNSPSTIASGYVFIGLRLFVGKTDNPILGSINLSQFSITVDGKEVFSGNKTGIDTIKADNYDVVGSPVISDDGVASGFSNDNYLTTPTIDFASANRWKVVSKFRYFASNVTMSVYQFLKGNTNNALYINPSGYIKIYIKTVGNTTVDFSSQTASSSHSAVSLTSGSDVVAELEFTGTQYIFKVYQNGSLIYADTKGSTNAIYPSNTNGLNIGISAFDGYFTTGSIDLNSFKIYVDDNLAYQPCLKIPYTQSKTGSKIVDGGYRDRVQDMYNQFGYTHYYTLGDTDFTLATCKGSDVVESGDNYEQTADLTLKQWGSATSAQTVNLLPYKDTNYAVTLTNGSKTKNSFVANATGDYIAVGKTVLG